MNFDASLDHHNRRPTLPRAFRSLFVLPVLLLLAACGDDGVSSEPSVLTEVGVVVNSLDLSLTIFPVDDPEASTSVGLGPDGSPVTVAVRGDRALVPLGTVPAVAVVDLRERTRIGTIALPENSGASGVAFIDDTLAVVANPNLNSVSIVNLEAASLEAEIDTGIFPQRVLVREGRIYVLNAELGPDFQPARMGTITVLDASDYSHVATIEVSGDNPGGGDFGPDGLLYVSLAGSFGAGNGAVSVVDPAGLTEVAHHAGFGDFPGALAMGPDGNLYVAAFSYGVAVFDPATGGFIRAPEEAVAPGGVPSSSGIAFDSEDRLYALTPDCQAPATAHRLDPITFEPDLEITVGTCPIGIAFSEILEPND